MNANEEIIAQDPITTSEIHGNIDQESQEIIEICEKSSNEFRFAGDNLFTTKSTQNESVNVTDTDIPDDIYWHSLLTAMQDCRDYPTLEKKCLVWHWQGLHPLQPRVQPLQPRVQPSYFKPGCDSNDQVAQKEIPPDGPMNLLAVWIEGDGNCLPPSLGKGYFNDSSRHLEMRARMVIEGIVHKEYYLCDSCLERGASCIHGNADLPTVFATFSEFYTSCQKLTQDAVEDMYCMEMYSCSKIGSCMGIWQLAQAASVLRTPLHTIYPICGECSIRNDFHRMFFLINYPATQDDDPIVIMWTPITVGTVPIHFIPLLKKCQ